MRSTDNVSTQGGLLQVSSIFGVGGAFLANYGIKKTIDYQPESRKNAQYKRRICIQKKIDYWRGLAPFGIKITLLSAKQEKMIDIIVTS